MELEFDKEIDALMRKAAGRSVLAGDRPAGHLDTDELAAFAENAMPEKTRALHMADLADCDRCRRILSGLIAFNADDAERPAASIAAPAIIKSAAPWYRRLFLFPNLAYVMGGLVLIFGGLLTFSLLQSSQLNDTATVSQSVETEAARAPVALEPAAGSSADSAANASNANTALLDSNTAASPLANAASNTAVAAAPMATPENRREDSAAEQPLADVTTGSTDTKAAPVDAPPAAPPAAAPSKEEVFVMKGAKPMDDKDEAKKQSVAEAEKMDSLSMKSRQVNELPRTQAGGPAKAKPGPSRDALQNRANNTYEVPESRRVGGRNFQFRNGAWYDTSYRGQPTINVRRGTDEYKRLDGGLRSTAENLNGVVVIVWGAKAYRVQ